MSIFDELNKNAASNTAVMGSGQSNSTLAFNQEDTYSPALAVDTNKLIRNTYTLLSMTLLFSACVAGVAMALNIPHPGFIISLVGYIGLFFVVNALKNSAWGILAVFALTGFMGMTLGPILNLYLAAYTNGHTLIMMSFGATAAIFLGLSGYALTTRKDFSFMGSFLFAGLIVAFLAGLGAWLFSIPMLSLAVSAVMVLLMTGYILYDTSNMVHGQETNYIMATVNLYVDIYSLFLNLLSLLGFFMGERE
jgi:modulator of FtsH protease